MRLCRYIDNLSSTSRKVDQYSTPSPTPKKKKKKKKVSKRKRKKESPKSNIRKGRTRKCRLLRQVSPSKPRRHQRPNLKGKCHVCSVSYVIFDAQSTAMVIWGRNKMHPVSRQGHIKCSCHTYFCLRGRLREVYNEVAWNRKALIRKKDNKLYLAWSKGQIRCLCHTCFCVRRKLGKVMRLKELGRHR